MHNAESDASEDAQTIVLDQPGSLCDAIDNAGGAIHAASSMKALTSGLQWD